MDGEVSGWKDEWKEDQRGGEMSGWGDEWMCRGGLREGEWGGKMSG